MAKEEKNKEKIENETTEEIKEEKVEEVKEEKEEKKEDKKKESKKDKKDEKKESPEDKLKEELKSANDKYVRLFAEYDNYRKRTQNEKLGIFDDATARAVTELLPIADSIVNAMSSLENTEVPEEYKKGIELIAQQLKSSFEKLGVEEFGEVGDEFDPELHNAVGKIEDENLEKNSLAAVYQKGFKLKNKIVRHAMVQVANCD